MSTITNLDKLKINYLTQEQYDTAAENNELNENELYFTPGSTEESSISDFTSLIEDTVVYTPDVTSGIKLGEIDINGSTNSIYAPTGVTKTKATVTLTTSAWSSNTATVVVAGVTADNDVFITPIPEHLEIFGEAKIICSGQSTNTLTFTCDSVPSTAITINVLILT